MTERDQPLTPGAMPATVDLPGRLILIVGASETGGETPFDTARRLLSGDPRWVFPRRVATGADDGRSGDIAAEETAFLQVRARGGFALTWTSGGRWYGVPAAIDADLARGARVVVAVARTVIAEARRRWPDVTVIEAATGEPPAAPAPGGTDRFGDAAPGDTAGRRSRVAAFLSAVLAD